MDYSLIVDKLDRSYRARKVVLGIKNSVASMMSYSRLC